MDTLMGSMHSGRLGFEAIVYDEKWSWLTLISKILSLGVVYLADGLASLLCFLFGLVVAIV